MLNANKNIYRYLLPNLLEIQRASYCWFLEKGLIQELETYSIIQDYLGELELNFATKYYKIKAPTYTLEETKRKDLTYSVKIFVRADLVNHSNIYQSQHNRVLLCDIPLITNSGTFLVNGIERVVINQLVRSPGIYYKTDYDKQKSKIYTAGLISNRGTWLKFEIDKDDFLNIRIDKAKKFSAYVFLKALGLEESEIFASFDNVDYFRRTSSVNSPLDMETALLEVHAKLRPEEPPSAKSCQQFLYSKFFDLSKSTK